MVLLPPEGEPLRYALALTFPATNNEAEYEALIAGLLIAKGAGAKKLAVRCDSQLVANQVKGEYAARTAQMKSYLRRVKELIPSFDSFCIQGISRDKNQVADALSKLASGGPPTMVNFIETVHPPHPEVLTVKVLEKGYTWMTPFIKYLKDGALPQEKKEAERIQRRAASYLLLEGTLYKRGYNTPLLRCVADDEAKTILKEVHEGAAGAHEGPKALVQKAMRQGFYWPTMAADAKDLVTKCVTCQLYGNVQRQPPAEQVPIPSAWPFSQWGLDLLGPFPMARCQKKFIIVGIDYFTKWVEAEALAKITEDKVVKFLRDNIVTRFGVPRFLVMDNGPQFAGKKMKWACDEWGIERRFASVRHPQTNGQVESTNRQVLRGIQKRVEALKSNWVDELPHVLWASRITPRTTTGETPFSLVYGSEAVAPTETALHSYRVTSFDPETNAQQRAMELDAVEEKRLQSIAVQHRAKAAAARYFNRRVKLRQFFPGEMVLRRNEFVAQDRLNKLSPKWEGPYKVVATPHPNAYVLEDTQGRTLPRTFNAEHLKKFFV